MIFLNEEQKENVENIQEESNLAQSTTNRVNRNVVERRKKHRHKKYCWLCRQGKLTIDYKETELLKNYLRRYNKILIHKVSGNCLKHQHQLAQAIKRARFIALLPFVPE